MRCAKCHSKDICTFWHKNRNHCDDLRGYGYPLFEGEHLHHHCRNCSYEWREDVKDKSTVSASGGKEE